MADKINVELDELAFRIYSEMVAKQPANIAAERLALASYRKAESFLSVRGRVRSGELEATEPTGPQLADCSAPNLKKTHPHNLVSQRFGDLKRVEQIKAWLDKNPTAETYPELDWDVPTTNVARTIFPAYVKN